MFRTLSVSTRSMTNNTHTTTRSGRVVKPSTRLNPPYSEVCKTRKVRKVRKAPKARKVEPSERFVFDSVGVLPIGTIADPLSIWRLNFAAREYSPDVSASSSPLSVMSGMTEIVHEREPTELVWEREPTPYGELVAPVEPVPVEPEQAPAPVSALVLPKWGESVDLLGNRGVTRPASAGVGTEFDVKHNQLLLCGVSNGVEDSKAALAGRKEGSIWTFHLPQYGPNVVLMLRDKLAQEIVNAYPVARPDLGADGETMLLIWRAISDLTPTRPNSPVLPIAGDDAVMADVEPEVAEPPFPIQSENASSPYNSGDEDCDRDSESASTLYSTDGEDCDRTMALPSPVGAPHVDRYEHPAWVYSRRS